MAEKSETRITQTAAEAGGPVASGSEVKPTADKSAAEIKDSLTFQEDRDLHPTGEPKRSADKTSSPGGEAYPDDPPVRTGRPDVPIVRSLVTGAGAHVPPDPKKYTPEGRPRYDAD